ncbi:MAG: response regulator transcription factor [Bacteroidales bacterium]|nr:response regulator transcription factor [Bacteroidales bacterium]MDY6347474.1 response regulator transcription factor [Bacteroidales bacterium]
MKLKKEKIMLVDSSDNLRRVIKDYLEMSDFNVVDFKNGVDADNCFNKNAFDICIVDVALKDCDGFKLLQKLRQVDRSVPIVVLSSLAGKEDRIRCFNIGCDDYVTKPFSIEELCLRVNAILRRCANNSKRHYETEDEIIKFGNFTLNYTELQLVHPKVTRLLTRKECDLLKLLLDHKNKLVPREIILREIWTEDDNSNSRSMDVFMTKLRTYILVDCEEFVLPKSPGQRKIHYVPGFVPPVEIVNIHGTGFMIKVRENE